MPKLDVWLSKEGLAYADSKRIRPYNKKEIILNTTLN